ncbi:MAG: DivIVA domain-containing protein [Hydrogenoanaerobacterium sp.]
MNSQTILTRKFERSAIGGYRNDDVDNFLNEVAQSYDELEEQNKVLLKKLEVLAEKLEEYRSDEESLRAALLGAQKLGDSVIRESKNKAEIILRDANIKAERILSGAIDKNEKEKMVYIKLQKDVAAFKNKLIATYKQHLALISSLPDDPDKEKEEEAAKREAEQPARPPMQPPNIPQKEEWQQQDLQVPTEPAQLQEEPEHIFEDDENLSASKQEDSYKEQAVQKPRKFIPVPHYEDENDASAMMSEQKKSRYADEYYEDFSEENEKSEEDSVSKKPSRFGTLKFGAGYDLKRE